MKKINFETVAQVLLVILLVIVGLCLMELRHEIRGVADALEQFKQETYDRERDLLAVDVETTPVIPIEKCVAEPEIPAEKCEEHEKADTVEPETHEKADSWGEDYVLRVLTAEAGADQVLCGCVAQCMFNACDRTGWACSIPEVLEQYGYTGPASWISEAAVQAYDEVFCSGMRYVDVEDALYFYAPQYCTSEWHENQRFIVEVSGVRFFGRWE